jgi:hypothetical protein
MALKETVRFCGELYDPKDPASARCIVPKSQHDGKPHQGPGRDGKIRVWADRAEPGKDSDTD